MRSACSKARALLPQFGFLLLCAASCWATTYTASHSGVWSSAATWGDAGTPGSGDRAICSGPYTITLSANTIVGDSPAAGTNVLTQSGSCVIIPNGFTLLIQGGWSKLGSVTRSAGDIIKFDSSGAANPAATPYTLTDNGVWRDSSTYPPTNTAGNQYLPSTAVSDVCIILISSRSNYGRRY